MSTEAKRKYSFELLADYVDGLVDANTAASIERSIETDEETRSIVEGIRFFYESKSADREGLEEYLDDFADRLAQKVEAGPQRSSRGGFSSTFRIAAAVALLITAGYLFLQLNGQSGNPVIAQLEETYPGPVTTRSATPDITEAPLFETEQSATQAYNSGDYDRAADLFYELIAARQDSDEWIFYGAISQLYDKEYEAAIGGFEQLKSLYYERGAPGVFNQQGEWYLSLALYQGNRKEEAREIWQKISAQESHYQRNAASELLESTQ